MVREIKFRFYVDGEMAYCDILNNERNDKNINAYVQNMGGDTIMQYTGLKDKNGKEIYEGDIVECRHVVGNLYPIDGNYEYENVLEAVSWDKNEVRFTRGHSNWGGECEIVGNIYESPELLK